MSRIVSNDTYYSSQSKEMPYKWASIEVLKFSKYSTQSGKH